MDLDLSRILNLWLVIRYPNGDIKIIQNSSNDLLTASLSPIERYKLTLCNFNFEDDITGGPLSVIFKSDSHTACKEFLSRNGLKEREIQAPTGSLEDAVRNAVEPLHQSLTEMKSNMCNISNFINALQEMSVEQFCTDKIKIPEPQKDQPKVSENGHEELGPAGDGQPKKKNRHKAKKTANGDSPIKKEAPVESVFTTLDLPVAVEEDDESMVEYTLRIHLKKDISQVVKKKSRFVHRDPKVLAFCVFSEENGVSFNTVKRVPGEPNTFTAEVLLPPHEPAYLFLFMKNDHCLHVERETDSQTFATFRCVYRTFQIIDGRSELHGAKTFVVSPEGQWVPVDEMTSPERGIRYVIRCP